MRSINDSTRGTGLLWPGGRNFYTTQHELLLAQNVNLCKKSILISNRSRRLFQCLIKSVKYYVVMYAHFDEIGCVSFDGKLSRMFSGNSLPTIRDNYELKFVHVIHLLEENLDKS